MILVSSCEEAIEPIIIKYRVKGTFQVPTNLQIAAHRALPAVTAFNPTDSVLASEGFAIDQVNEIMIDSIYVTKNDTFGVDLNFLQELDLLLEGGTAQKMLIANTGDLPALVDDTIGLSATTRDLKEYLMADSVLIWPELIIDQTVLSPTKLKVIIDMTLELESEP